jgi:hypothetical protein
MPRKTTNIDVKHAYQRLFLLNEGGMTDIARLVIGDLIKVTGGVQSPVQYDSLSKVDTEATLIALGCQKVWLHINSMLHLPERTTMGLMQDAIHVGVDHDRHDD